MDQEDLLIPEGIRFVARLNRLAEELDETHLPVTSWYGGLSRPGFEFSIAGVKSLARRLTWQTGYVGPTAEINVLQRCGNLRFSMATPGILEEYGG